MPRIDQRTVVAIGIAVLAALPFVNTIRNGFTFDDVPLVAENPRIRSLAAPARLLATDWWGGTRPQSLLYRPLAMSSFALDYALAARGTAPAPARLPDAAATPFHVQNVLWHAAASVALFFLVAELFPGILLAAAAAALFAVHPVHSEAVAGIVGRAELMAACLSFLALWAAARMRVVLAAAALLAALLSKEQAVTIPLVAAAWLWIGGRPAALRRCLGALAIAVACYLAARAAVLGTPFGVAHAVAGVDVDNPVASATGAGRLLTPLRVFGEVCRLLVFPRILSADYSYDQIPVVTALDGATVASLLALLSMVAAVFALRRRAPAVACGVALFLLTWLLTSNLFVTIGTILGERLLYLPSAGVCLAAAAGLIALGRRLSAPWLASGLITLLVLAGAGRSWVRNPDWKNNLSLFAATVRSAPRSCKAANGYASELFARGRARDAVIWAEKALAIEPGYVEAHGTLAKIDRVLASADPDPEKSRALRDQARRHAELVLAASGQGANPYVRGDASSVLGALSLDEGRFADAEQAFRAGLAARPNDVTSLEGLGIALVSAAESEADPGRREAALSAAIAPLERAIALDPGHPEVLQNASTALRDLAALATDPSVRSERLKRADAYEDRAIALSPTRSDPAAAANLHGLRGQRFLAEGRSDEALAEFREAARLTPDAARVYLGIGTTLAVQADAAHEAAVREGLLRDAIAAFERAEQLEPQNPDAHLNLGIVLLRMEREPARAAGELRTYLRLAPDSPLRPKIEETLRRMP